MTIYNDSKDRKWEIKKINENSYRVTCFEYYSSCGWRQIGPSENYDKACLEWEFEIEVA